MKDKKAVWMSAFTNVVPAEYEKWMEEMEAQGWHVDKIGQWSSIRMVFRRGEPRKYRYVYDMQAFPQKDYVSTYQSFGWEFVGRMASSFLWRKPYEKERPEAFTDAENLEKRGKRFAGAASVSMVLFWAALAVILIVLLARAGSLRFDDRLNLGILLVFMAFLAGGMTYVVRKIYKNRKE